LWSAHDVGPGVSPGYWWVQRPDGAGRQIVLVSGDESDETAQIVKYVGGGFWSVRMTRSRGFVFTAKVPEMEEVR